MKEYKSYLEEVFSEKELLNIKKILSIFILVLFVRLMVVCPVFPYGDKITSQFIDKEAKDYVTGCYNWYDGVIVDETPLYNGLNDGPCTYLECGDKVIFAVYDNSISFVIHGPFLYFGKTEDIRVLGLYNDENKIEEKTFEQLVHEVIYLW